VNSRRREAVEGGTEGAPLRDSQPRFQDVSARVDFPALDARILTFWKDHGIFEKSLEISAELASSMFAFKNLTLRGSGGQRWDMAIEFVRSGQIRTEDLITHRFPLNGIGEGFETQLDACKSIKVMIVP